MFNLSGQVGKNVEPFRKTPIQTNRLLFNINKITINPYYVIEEEMLAK
jgi:hypothetical protein